ncbi:MAG: hypothetical protein Q7S29_04200 [Candidatus Peribacter sp.]|nr:hypothetical protein [Candidatus Peribacter sp.]
MLHPAEQSRLSKLFTGAEDREDDPHVSGPQPVRQPFVKTGFRYRQLAVGAWQSSCLQEATDE